MKTRDINRRARSLGSATPTISCALFFALVVTIPGYSQKPADRAWEILKAGISSKSADSRERAFQAMGLISTNPTAEKMSLAALMDEKPQVRAAAASCLGQVGSQHAIPALQKALSDSQSEVLFAAAGALFRLKDPAAYRVYYAVLMRETKSGDSLLDSQMKMMKDPKALAKVGFEQGMAFVPFAGLGYGAFKAIRKDDESPIRAAAALRLAHDPDPKSAEALATAAGDEKWMVRAAAIDAIGQRGDATLLKAVVPRLEDENEAVRFNAAACIIRLSN